MSDRRPQTNTPADHEASAGALARSAAATTTTTSTSTRGLVERAFRLLQTVVAADQPIGIRELSRRTGLPRSTVSRLVTTLAEIGMVERLSDATVGPGSALATLQHQPTDSTELLRDRLRPLLAELVGNFNENAALSIEANDGLLYLSQANADHKVSVPDIGGTHHPYHLVAPGLVTMAWWPEDRLSAHLSGPLKAPTEFSVTDPDEIQDRLARLRYHGYVWTDQELDLGINGVAVPLFSNGELLATVSLFGPSYRFSAKEFPGLGTELVDIVTARAAALVP